MLCALALFSGPDRLAVQGELVIQSQTTRSQADNLDDAIGRLQDLLREAAESIKPIESDPDKVKKLQKRKKKVCFCSCQSSLVHSMQ